MLLSGGPKTGSGQNFEIRCDCISSHHTVKYDSTLKQPSDVQ